MKITGHYILKSIGDGDYILIPERSGDTAFTGMCSLNSTGAFVWRNIEKNKSIAEISKIAAEKYNVDENTAENDVTAFLESLSDIGILKL